MLHQMKTGTIILSIGYLLVGLMLLIMPQTSLGLICFAFGLVILVSGIVNLVRYFRVRGKGLSAPFLLIGGVVALGLGLFLLLKPAFVMSILPVVLGLFIVLDGILRICNSVELGRAHGQKWWMLLLLGILSVGLGALVVFHPFDAIVSVAMLCGVMLIIEGALNLGCIIYASMELRTLARLAEAAMRAVTDPPTVIPEDTAEEDPAQEDVVCDAEATVVDAAPGTPPDQQAPDLKL